MAAAAVLAAAAAVVHADFRACVEKSGAEVLGDGDDSFDGAVARAVYPSPTPQWYVDVAEAKQVAGVLACARDEGLGVCPRSGGHSFVSGSSCEGVVLDVHKLKALHARGVKMKDGGKEAVVGAGNTVSEMLYGVLQGTDGGRMVGVTYSPSVGVAGYVLGGGHCPYSGRLGLTCESVKEYVYVTPVGKTLKASNEENEELFWASCGGGGAHFGVLTEFTIATHNATVFDREPKSQKG